MPVKPDIYLLQGGMWHCKTCVPPIDIKADGHAQPVAGHPYFDAMAVTVVDDRTIHVISSRDGRVVATNTVVVAPDGHTASFEFSDSTATTGAPVTGTGQVTRVANGPAGSHAVSGSWRTTKLSGMSDNGITVTYRIDGDMLTMTTPSGQSYTANLDGTDAPMVGDPGTTSVSVKRVGANGIEETDKRNGKVISVARSIVASNGKSMTLSFDDKEHGSTSQFVMDKQ
jgi:hypothetical protein